MDADYIKHFNETYTNNTISKLKVLQCFASGKSNPYMAILIKYLELRYTLSLVANASPREDEFSLSKLSQLISSMKPFSTPEEVDKWNQLLSLLDLLETYEMLRGSFDSLDPETLFQFFQS